MKTKLPPIMKTLITNFFFLLLCITSIKAQKSLEATRIFDKITIDGHIDESNWSQSEIAGDFITWSPNPGKNASLPTDVQVLYDDEAMYIAATMHVTHKDSIARELVQRDDIGNTDWFGVVIDTYGNGTDGVEFIVSSTGVQFDAKMTDNGEDTNWDAVWFSEVQINDDSWVVEMKIPYAALRFANKPEQSWRVNFMRSINMKGERSSWNPFDPKLNGFLTQAGIVTGLKEIKPPLRLSFSPYLTTYAQSYSSGGTNPTNSSGYSYNGGMDVKYGITDAFTLDMTLIPDFGQVRSDDVVLNLSPFEVRYDENRQFFTEGIELFDEGDLFYSRRIGGSPIGQYGIYGDLTDQDDILENPSNSQLYNATKISGRTGGGLGIGIFNAVSKETNAIIHNRESNTQRAIQTAPLTNYNIISLDQNLANNSAISFMNTNVYRTGNRFHDANVSNLGWDLKNKAQSYRTFGRIAYSQLINPNEENVNGHNINMGVGKISGNTFLNLEYSEISENYNSNDLGFLFRNNFRRFNFNARYGVFEQFGAFNRGNFWFNAQYERQKLPNRFSSLYFNAGFWMQAKNFWQYNMWMNYSPGENDFNEPRSFGRFYRNPAWFNTGFYISTDNRKKLRLSGYAFVRKSNEEGRYSHELYFNPTYQFSNQLTIDFDLSVENEYNDVGWVDFSGDDIILGYRNRKTHVNSINAIYTINDKMGIDFRLRHYWSSVAYNKFNALNEDGSLRATEYNDFNDFTFNAFNIDLNYRWRFAPGSDIIFNWKNNISGARTNQNLDYQNINYFDGIDNLKALPQTNSISVRLIYFLDYNELVKAF